ncbi:MAG: PEP-CTERM sorting domain-containing protein [bacterium]|nr:PEP-CTERM sorting domain-containing protein [bacterium]
MIRKLLLLVASLLIATGANAFSFDSGTEGWTYDSGWGTGITADPAWSGSLDHTGNGGGVIASAVALQADGSGGALNLMYATPQDLSSYSLVKAYVQVDTNPIHNVGGPGYGIGARLHIKTGGAWTTYMGNWINLETANTWHELTLNLAGVPNLSDVRAIGVHIGDGGASTWSGNLFIDDVNLIPEPGSLIMLGAGLLGLIGFAARKRK